MTESSNARLLDQLVGLKKKIGAREAKRIISLLRKLRTRTLDDAESLIRLHEVLLFLRAYPQTAAIVAETESQLRRFSQRVKRLSDQDIDLWEMRHPDVSGVSGTYVTDTFTYDIVRWLSRKHPSEISLSWDWFEDENRLGEAWPRFMPLLEEDAFVEAHVPYEDWLRAASGEGYELTWLMKRFETLLLTVEQKAELFNAQQLYTTWTPSYSVSRSGLRSGRTAVFYHRTPLIERRDVHFREEVTGPPPRVEKLSRDDGEEALDKAREASTIRYRELYGFTHGDPNCVYKVDLGRGVDLFVMGLPPGRRLPLRAYHSAMIFKNAVPIGYFEGLSIFERMESGFNLYYTFRDGETAWLYARTLNVMRHVLGVTVFSLEPYQLGHDNEEGIQSGAFWFYRKLGFRSTKSSLRELTQEEEEKLRARERYRTPATTLRKLAAAPMVLEVGELQEADWDRFQMRNIGMAVQRHMQLQFAGDPDRMRESAIRSTCKLLGVTNVRQARHEKALADFAFALLPIRKEVQQWNYSERRRLWEIIKAKVGANENSYLQLMQNHAKLRAAFISLGSEK